MPGPAPFSTTPLLRERAATQKIAENFCVHFRESAGQKCWYVWDLPRYLVSKPSLKLEKRSTEFFILVSLANWALTKIFSICKKLANSTLYLIGEREYKSIYLLAITMKHDFITV